jgi:outer membrane protein
VRGPRRGARSGERAIAAGALALVAVVAGASRAADGATPASEQQQGAEQEQEKAQAQAQALTLDQALAMARKANRSLIVERARLAQAQTSVEQAWAALFPTIAAQGKYTRNYKKFEFGTPMTAPLLIQPENQLDAVVTGTVPLLAPAAYPALEAVKKNVLSSQANLETAEATVLFSVAQTFYAAAVSEEVMVARRSSIEVARATLRNAEARFGAGTVTKVDVDRAELALVRAQQLERESRYGREQAYRALGTLIQAPGPFRVSVAAEQQAAPLPSPAASRDGGGPGGEVDAALQLRPEFRSLRFSLEAAEAQRRAQGWRWAPTLSAFGNARKFNYDNFARDRYSWAVGGQLDWVLWDGGTRDALRHQAAAQAAEAQARAEVLRDSIRDDLASGRSLIATKSSAREAAVRSVALAKEALDLVRTQYQAGTATQVDLLQAQDSLVVSQEALAQAHFDLAVADLTFRRAAGTFPGK